MIPNTYICTFVNFNCRIWREGLARTRGFSAEFNALPCKSCFLCFTGKLCVNKNYCPAHTFHFLCGQVWWEGKRKEGWHLFNISHLANQSATLDWGGQCVVRPRRRWAHSYVAIHYPIAQRKGHHDMINLSYFGRGDYLSPWQHYFPYIPFMYFEKCNKGIL